MNKTILPRGAAPSAPAPGRSAGALLRLWPGPVHAPPNHDQQREAMAAPLHLQATRALAAQLSGRLFAELAEERDERVRRGAFLRAIARAHRQHRLAADRLRRVYSAPCDRTPPTPAGRPTGTASVPRCA